MTRKVTECEKPDEQDTEYSTQVIISAGEVKVIVSPREKVSTSPISVSAKPKRWEAIARGVYRGFSVLVKIALFFWPPSWRGQ
jgi:hypothetical protein